MGPREGRGDPEGGWRKTGDFGVVRQRWNIHWLESREPKSFQALCGGGVQALLTSSISVDTVVSRYLAPFEMAP